MQRFLFPLSLIIGLTFELSIPDRCRSNWHYLFDERICVLLGTTYVGDVSWKNSSQACQQNSGQLWSLASGRSLQAMTREINENERYLDIFQRGTWIGETSKHNRMSE